MKTQRKDSLARLRTQWGQRQGMEKGEETSSGRWCSVQEVGTDIDSNWDPTKAEVTIDSSLLWNKRNHNLISAFLSSWTLALPVTTVMQMYWRLHLAEALENTPWGSQLPLPCFLLSSWWFSSTPEQTRDSLEPGCNMPSLNSTLTVLPSHQARIEDNKS